MTVAIADTPSLIQRLRANPDLQRLSSREVEALVAELLASFGWQINLTSAKRDGGRDILAVSCDASGLETTWIVECKRYSVDHKVGIREVRELLGVQHQFGFPKALLITTSTATVEARLLADAAGSLHLVEASQLLDWIGAYTHRLGQPPFAEVNRFQSCFVSYSHKDEKFVSTLVARLRSAGVRVWFAPEDMNAGAKLEEEISRAIKTFDRLVVVLSENSMNSAWVKSELRKARNRELTEERRVLFPVSLVSFEELRQWEVFDADLGQDLANEVRQYFIPGFEDWTTPAAFEKQFVKILAGLKQP